MSTTIGTPTPISQPVVPPAYVPYKYKVTGLAADGSEIRKFSDERIASQIEAAVKSVTWKDGQNLAIVGYTDGQMVRGALLVKKTVSGPFGKSIDFSFAGVLSHDFTTGDTKKEAGFVVQL